MKLTIGEKIALLRREKNITQTELAEYLFLAPQAVSRWEAGSGAPEITLLPKIAGFFGVSIDELFGLTSIERAEDLASKYSVLRDDRSFHEAMECVNSQIQTIDASLKNGSGNAGELEKKRDKLETLKLHIWVQQGREAFQRALKIAESFAVKTEGNPEHPWYLRMRLQRNQLLAALEKGRGALAECKRNFLDNPNAITLQIYFSMLSDLQNYEEILSIQRTESPVNGIIFPPSEGNSGIWRLLIHAAAELDDIDFIERYIPPVLEVCSGKDEFDFLLCLLDLYRAESQREKRAAIKARLLSLLPGMSFNKYFEENVKKRIGQSCQ